MYKRMIILVGVSFLFVKWIARRQIDGRGEEHNPTRAISHVNFQFLALRLGYTPNHWFAQRAYRHRFPLLLSPRQWPPIILFHSLNYTLHGFVVAIFKPKTIE